MRVLPGIERAEFDVPTEVFTIRTATGTKPDAVLDAIRDLGYTPELLDGPPPAVATLTNLEDPKSSAVKEALARAKARGVLLVVDFGATWCGPCKAFAKTTLADERVQKALEGFELLAIDIDEDPVAAKDFGVAGVPDVWFVAPDGRVVGRENRFMNADAFLAALNAVAR